MKTDTTQVGEPICRVHTHTPTEALHIYHKQNDLMGAWIYCAHTLTNINS